MKYCALLVPVLNSLSLDALMASASLGLVGELSMTASTSESHSTFWILDKLVSEQGFDFDL